MDSSFTASIKAYREAAANRFLTASTLKKTTKTENQVTPPHLTRQQAPYQRTEIPGLDEYLQSAAKAYAKSETLIELKKLKQPKQAQALGHGEPVEHLHASLRKERWLRAQAGLKHFIRSTQQVPVANFVVHCGIPRDVLARAASQFLLHKKLVQQTSLKPKPSWNVLGKRLVNERIELLGIREHPEFCIYTKRCEEFLAAGRNAIVATTRKVHVTCDTFEDVRRRYAGRPDELYRRKTARRYAIWRRKRLEKERNLRECELQAEKEMKRRRGHDRLLTSRPTGDSSFAPFLYELGNNTYAYSSKITEAPKLRKIMVEKYTGSARESETEPSQWQRATQIANTTPLFHTRVMNRFS